jgi:starch synthase
MPKYATVNERRNQLHEVIRLSGMNLIIDDTDYSLIIKVASIQAARMQVYFIDNEDFFHRKYLLMDSNGNEFEDNDERCIFYVRGVIETVKKLRWVPDLIHCHGWITALAPIYIKKHYKGDPCFKNAKVVYSIYNDEFKKPLRENFAKKVKIEGVSQNDLKQLKEMPDFFNLTKLAIDFSDGIIEGRPDIRTDLIEYAKGKEGLHYLSYQCEENYVDEFNKFYDLILNK